jgi:oxygen-dependent protoporphyrinogen oxidase
MIGIVGAGISGLALSLELEEAGIPHEVLEASDRTGGVIWSSSVGEAILDHGPQRTRVTPAMARLISRLELTNEQVVVPQGLPLFVVREGKLRKVPWDALSLLRSDILTPRGKLRLLAEPLAAPPRPDETVSDFLIRKFGTEAYANILGPLFGGLYGSNPAEMYVRHGLAETLGKSGTSRGLFLRYLRGDTKRVLASQATSFTLGMAQLTEAMSRAVSHRVSLNQGVVALAPVQDRQHAEPDRPGEGGRWAVTLTSGETRMYQTVVLTLPADTAASLVAPMDADAAQRLASLRYNTLAIVHLQSPETLHGLGYQIGYGEPFRTRGVTWNASALGRAGVYTAFLGGARDPAILAEPDETIGSVAAREFTAITGAPAQVLAVTRTRIPSWDRSWVALDGLTLPDGLLLCSNYESRVGIPGRLARAQTVAEALGAGDATSRETAFRQKVPDLGRQRQGP